MVLLVDAMTGVRAETCPDPKVLEWFVGVVLYSVDVTVTVTSSRPPYNPIMLNGL